MSKYKQPYLYPLDKIYCRRILEKQLEILSKREDTLGKREDTLGKREETLGKQIDRLSKLEDDLRAKAISPQGISFYFIIFL